jgi:hypothetical protein
VGFGLSDQMSRSVPAVESMCDTASLSDVSEAVSLATHEVVLRVLEGPSHKKKKVKRGSHFFELP